MPPDWVYGVGTLAARPGRRRAVDDNNKSHRSEGVLTMKHLITAALIALALTAAPVFAEEGNPSYLWVTCIKAKPGQGDAVVGEMMKEDAKIFDPLVESGAAWEWGIAMPVFHDGNDSCSHLEWVVFNGWAGADAFMKRFMELRQASGAEANKAMAERWAAITEPGSHADFITRGVHLGAGKPQRATYIHLGYHKAKPGRYSELEDQYKKYVVPVYDKLVADGTVISYGLETPEVHRGEGWDFMSWWKSSDLAARDAVDAAFDAANAARSEAERKAMRESSRENMDWSGHADQVLVVVHHNPGKGE